MPPRDWQTDPSVAKYNLEQARKKASECPLCAEQGRPKTTHTYRKNFPRWPTPGHLDWPSHRLTSCQAFLDLDHTARGKYMVRIKACMRCAAFLHQQEDCRLSAPKCRETLVGGGLCGERHMSELHSCPLPQVQALGVSLAQPSLADSALRGPLCTFLGPPALLAIFSVTAHSSDRKLKLLCDEGSMITMVRHDTAWKLGAGPGTPWSYNLQVVGEQYRPVSTRLYTLHLRDNKGEVHTVVAAGTDKISCISPSPDLQAARDIFPNILESSLQRPHGEVDILLGSCDSRLLPFGGQRVGNLRLEESPWGQVLRGTAPSLLLPPGPQLYPEAMAAAQSSLKWPPGAVVFPGLHNFASLHISSHHRDTTEQPNFWESEELGAGPRPQCGEHRDCQGCRTALEYLSPREREVLARLDSGIKVEKGVTTVSYPWLSCVSRLRDNSGQATAVQSSVERSLLAKGQHTAFTEEMEKALARGAFSIVSPKELEERRRSGQPMHYLAVFGVAQPTHQGHKLRAVANSKLKNVHCGLLVNDCVESPPNAMVPMLEVLLWFRTNLHILLLDLQRAYQALRTGEMEKYTRLFLWRRSPRDRWITYGYDRVTFGDQVAATVLELTKARASVLGHSIHPPTATQLKNKVYVDDGCIAGKSREELEEMRGTKLDDGTYDGHISKILATCGMHPKFIAVAGEDEGQEEQIGGAVLGVGYNCHKDVLTFSFPPAYHVRARGSLKEEKHLTRAEVDNLKQGNGRFSLRIAASYVMGQFDPLGLCAPISMRTKSLLRRSHAASEGWDKELPRDIKEAWGDLVGELWEAGTVFFPRSTVPLNSSDHKSLLVGFGDGSSSGFAAAVYAVWPQSGCTQVNLVMSKARLAPASGGSVPRMEMSSAVLLGRLMLLVLRSAGFQPEETLMLLDSECSVAALQRRDGTLRPYFAHRTAEVAETIDAMKLLCPVVHPMQAVAGRHNAADIATRGSASVRDITTGSAWQQGPDFLQQPRDSWPIKTSVCDGVIPASERLLHASSCHLTSLLQLNTPEAQHKAAPLQPEPEVEAQPHLDNSRCREKQRPFPLLGACRNILGIALSTMNYSNSLEKSTRILARVLQGALQGNRENVKSEPSAIQFRAARALQFLATAPASRLAFGQGRLQSLGAVCRQGEVWIQGRVTPEDMASVLGCSALRVVMPETRLAQLIMISCHTEDHRRDPRDTMARARKICWIPRGRQLALKIVKNCPSCKREDKRLGEQIMADLPSFKTSGLAPFEAVGCDFMGPYMVKGMCGGRRYFKCWVTVYTCYSSHATVLLATPGYDTKTFVTTHARYCNTYSPPKLIVIDAGPNLVCAAERPDWQEVARASGWAETEWKVTPKGCHWRAGQVERVVGLAKRSMNRLLAGQTFTGDFHQLEALLARIQWLLNSRPVATHSQSDTDFHLISPNDIILGRAARIQGRIPTVEELEEPGVTLAAISHMEKVARAWHAAWVKQAWPHLVPRHRWQEKKQNVQPGDIGFLLYNSKFGKPAWRGCRVLEVHPDSHGVVRTVTVGLPQRSIDFGKKNSKSPVLSEMVVGVQRLAITFTMAEQREASSAEVNTSKKKVLQETASLCLSPAPGLARTPPSPALPDIGAVLQETASSCPSPAPGPAWTPTSPPLPEKGAVLQKTASSRPSPASAQQRGLRSSRRKKGLQPEL